MKALIYVLLAGAMTTGCASVHEKCMDRMKDFASYTQEQQVGVYQTCVEHEEAKRANLRHAFSHIYTPPKDYNTTCNSLCDSHGHCNITCN